MIDGIDRVLLSEEHLSETVSRLGKKISLEYKDKNLLMISVLKGSVVFMSDLMRKISIPCTIDFMEVSSYTGTESSGEVRILKDLDIPIMGYDVLVVEDILDSGKTLSYILEMLKSRNPKSIKLCALLDKPEARRSNICADYVGEKILNEFVVGYGLDCNEKYRNLPFVGVLSSKVGSSPN
ncbi:MAG: hypoxanthine phosphoribosyltransferase [Oscillospiraceae bacterium]|jgi:hypoxanthine phosphoribosyltransferase|nr:hypoxanthine phosphoribosyltransferase [Oscillospiraceae bacterium]